jgi:hypothetical protein
VSSLWCALLSVIDGGGPNSLFANKLAKHSQKCASVARGDQLPCSATRHASLNKGAQTRVREREQQQSNSAAGSAVIAEQETLGILSNQNMVNVQDKRYLYT